MSARNKHGTMMRKSQERASGVGAASRNMQYDVNCELNEVVAEVLESLNGTAKVAQVRHVLSLMCNYFTFFKTAFINLIDKILVLEEKDQLIKGLYSLISKFFSELHRASAQLNQKEVNTLLSDLILHLIQTYNLPKCPQQVAMRAAYFLAELSSHYGLAKVQLKSETKLLLEDLVIDLFHSQRTSLMLYGVQIATEICNQTNSNDQIYLQLMKAMTHCSSREVRKAVVMQLKAPFSQISLIMLGKRLRDKDDEIRRQTFLKLARCQVTIESFPSQELRMLIIKEGLTDPSSLVREACVDFLKPSMFIKNNDEEMKAEAKDEQENGKATNVVVREDLSYMFKLIDCRQIFIKEYYIQLPFIIMRFVFHMAGENDLKVAHYLRGILLKLKAHAGLPYEDHDIPIDQSDISFEEILFLRIAYEFTKVYHADRSQEFLDFMDQISLSFEDYAAIFQYLLEREYHNQYSDEAPNRLIFSEWVKFSLQLAIEDEVTRRNLVSLMFNYIGKVEHSYIDYQNLLKYRRIAIPDCDIRSLELAIDGSNAQEQHHDNSQEDGTWESQQDKQVIEIEIKEFSELAPHQRDINEYCKPFSFESLVIDSDDVCRIAVIVARKLLDARIDEFSLSMLQAIADIKEPLEEPAPPLNNDDPAAMEMYHDQQMQQLSFKRQRELIYKKMEQKLDQVNELVSSDDDYDVNELNTIMTKVRHYVALIEELNLKEKLSFKRALNLCLILLKQCRADVNDQNLISICETLIGPTIQSKDKDNMLLAIECIGLLCLLDKELFQNYSRIFQTILKEEPEPGNLREKIIALKSSVDSLIIHGVDQKSTLKLQQIIVEDYMVIKDRILRQTTIEGVCKMLFSRKLTQDADHNEMEFLLSQLIIQWFDRRFNWQNSLVRQLLNVFFKSFVLFSQQRCELMMKALTKVVFAILESKYGCEKAPKKELTPEERKKQQRGKRASGSSEKKKKRGAQKEERKRKNKMYETEDDDYEEDDDDDYDVKQDDSFVSDDSRCAQNQAYMQKICAELDALQISKVFLLLLSKEYVNTNAAKEFQLTKDLPVEFFLTLCYANCHKLRKVSVVKEFLAPLAEHVNLASCKDVLQMRLLQKVVEANGKMLIQAMPRFKRFQEDIDRRVEKLSKESEEAGEVENLISEEGGTSTIQTFEQRETMLAVTVEKLQEYYDDEIVGTLVDLVQDDQDEYYQQLHGLQIAGLKKFISSPNSKSLRKSSEFGDSESQQSRGGMSLRRRRSGLRSNKKRLMNTANDCLDSHRLKSIPEVTEDQGVPLRDLSSSEKPPRVRGKLLNDTILEERESIDRSRDLIMDIDQMHSQDSEQQLRASREQRRGIMSKLSKKMAMDFEENKKKSLSFQSAMSYTQINEQRLKEEYHDKTVYKITKGRSPIRGTVDRNEASALQQLEQIQDITNNQHHHRGLDYNVDPHNLSMQFAQIDTSMASSGNNNPKKGQAQHHSFEETKAMVGASKKNQQSSRGAKTRQRDASKENQTVAIAQPAEANRNRMQSSRLTRAQMKSASSSIHSNDDDDSDEEDSSSSQNAFDFMKSNLSRKAQEAAKKAAKVQQPVPSSIAGNIRTRHQQQSSNGSNNSSMNSGRSQSKPGVGKQPFSQQMNFNSTLHQQKGRR